jgi:exopolyphosphatase/pppGpp-phosphohydrolase
MTIFSGLLDQLPIPGRWMFLLVLSCIVVPHSAFSVDTGPVCAIDMGSNNFKLIIGEMKSGKYRQHYYMKDKLSVGTDMPKTGVINRAKLNGIRQILGKYLSVCDSARILTRSAVATAAFREAKNRRDVVGIANSLQLPFEIASEERESQLAYLVGTLGKRNFAVIDNGSRSIELVTRDAHRYQWSVFNLGYEIAFQQFFRSAKTFAEASDKYRRVLARYLLPAVFMKNRDGYIGVEMEHVARDLLSLDRADDVAISLDTVAGKMAALRDMTENEFAALKQVKNIDAILPRIVVLEQTLVTFGYREMQVFERELGVGLIVEKASGEDRWASQLQRR